MIEEAIRTTAFLPLSSHKLEEQCNAEEVITHGELARTDVIAHAHYPIQTTLSGISR